MPLGSASSHARTVARGDVVDARASASFSTGGQFGGRGGACNDLLAMNAAYDGVRR